MTKYMHTIDGKPGTFNGYQICFAHFYGPPNVLADSIQQIRAEQKLTIDNRSRDRLDVDADRYDYFRYS
jgi:hypothetical protein